MEIWKVLKNNGNVWLKKWETNYRWSPRAPKVETSYIFYLKNQIFGPSGTFGYHYWKILENNVQL